MTLLATLVPARLQIEPGTSAELGVEMRNTGQIVEAYRIRVLGALEEWATLEPAQVDGVLPGDSATVRVTFNVPRTSAIRAGEVDLGIQVVPVTDPDGAVVQEGVADVRPFLETTTELTPRISAGRRTGHHHIAVDNRGNVPLTVDVSASDPKNALRLAPRPERLTVDPGEAGFAELRARPARVIWSGADLTHPFSVTLANEDGAATSDGTYVQKAILPPWLRRAALLAVALAGALLAVWFLVFKPTVASAAREAVAAEVEEANEAAAAAQQSAAAAETAAAGAGAAASSATESLTGANEVLAGLSTPSELLAPQSIRLETRSSPGGPLGRDPYDVPAGATFRVTDFVMSNPQGDAGRMRVLLDDDVLFDMALENFRDLDFHFQAPIVAQSGQVLTLEVTCREVGTPPAMDPTPTQCDSAALIGGTLVTPNPAANPAP